MSQSKYPAKKSFTLILYTILIITMLLSLIFDPLHANAQQNTGPGTITGTIENLSFEEYMAVISEMTEFEEYPHFLEINAQRYEDYQNNNPDIPLDIVISHVNVNIDKVEYSDIEPAINPGEITVLVNKNFALSSDWEPDNFVDIGGGHLMHSDAAGQFIKMREAMSEDGLSLTIVITYRSYSSQRNHYNNAVARNGRVNADAGFARPGHSEHQLGLSVDVLHKAHDGGLMMNQGFDGSRQHSWLIENAYKYGFILRYPKGFRSISGFMYEPWHWRYVGVPIATVMHEKEIILYEEFYGRYLVQGVRDKVNAYILEQQQLARAQAEALELAQAEAAAEVERAALAAAAQAAAVEAAQKAQAEAQAIAEAQVILFSAKEAALSSAEELDAKIEQLEAAGVVMFSGGRHFLEGIVVLGISALFLVWFFDKKNR